MVPWTALVLIVMLFSGLWYFKGGLSGLNLKKGAIEPQAAVQGSAASEENGESVRTFKITPLPATDIPTAMQSLDLLPEVLPVPKQAAIESALESIAYFESRLLAVASILKCWDQPPPHQAQLPATFKDAEYFEIAARQYGLRMYTVQSNWSLVKQLNLPAILPLKNAQGGTVYMALVGWRDGQISLAAPDGRGVIHTSLDALLPYVNGPIHIYWKNAIGFDELITAWSPAKQVGSIKNLLRRSGYERVDSEPEFDQETEQAILDFQSRHSLEPDGLIGPLTKILLIQEAGIIQHPRLDEQEGRGGA
jgi:general secretion pathway protein A